MKFIKRTLLTAIIAFFPIAIFSQNFAYTYDVDSIEYAQPGNTITVHATISNLTANALTLDIVRAENNIPAGWETSMCIDICLPPNANSSVLYLPAYASQAFTMYFFTDSIASIGQTLIEITNQADTSQMLSLKFYGETSATASIFTLNYQDIDWSLYPNPATDVVNVQLSNINKPFVLMLYSSTGKLISTTTENKISILDLPDGIYYLILRSENEISNKKVIKK